MLQRQPCSGDTVERHCGKCRESLQMRDKGSVQVQKQLYFALGESHIDDEYK